MNNFYQKISNSRFYRLGDKLGDYIIASVLWFLLSIPIVTFIPSTSALYYTIFKKTKIGDSTAKIFMKSFKRNLKQGIILNILLLIASAISGLCIFIGRYGIGSISLPSIYFPISFITLIPIIFTFPFIISLLARFDNTVIRTIINAFTLSTMNLLTMILLWLLAIIGLALMIIFPPCLLVVPALVIRFYIYKSEKALSYAYKASNKGELENTEIEEETNTEAAE